MSKQPSFEILSVFAAAVLAFGVALAPSPASAAKTEGCGAIGQNACPLTKKAIFKGKATNKKPKGAFIDPRKGGEYWKCPSKYKRSVFPVNERKACVRKLTKFKKAEYLGKVFMKKPKGAFLDPRKGGEYWSCQKGYFRGPTKVTSKSACIVKPADVCKGKNVNIRGTCRKWKECGKEGKRPCLIVERVPSCNKGLLEDFVHNKCTNAAALVCTTLMGTLNGLQKGAKKLSKQQQKIEEQVGKTLDIGLKFLLGKKVHKELIGGIAKAQSRIEKTRKKVGKKLGPIVKKQIKKLLPDTEPIVKLAKALENNKDKMLKAALSKNFCLASPKDKMNTLLTTLGIDPKAFQKASLEQNWYDGLLIKNANAGTNLASLFSESSGLAFALGISATVTDIPPPLKTLFKIKPSEGTVGGGLQPGVGIAVSYYAVFKGNKVGQRLGLGVVLTSNRGYSLTPFIRILFTEKIEDVGGFGWSLGLGGSYEEFLPGSRPDPTLVDPDRSKGTTGQAGVGLTLLTLLDPTKPAGIELSGEFKVQTGQVKKVKGGGEKEFALDFGWGYDFALSNPK